MRKQEKCATIVKHQQGNCYSAITHEQRSHTKTRIRELTAKKSRAHLGKERKINMKFQQFKKLNLSHISWTSSFFQAKASIINLRCHFVCERFFYWVSRIQIFAWNVSFYPFSPHMNCIIHTYDVFFHFRYIPFLTQKQNWKKRKKAAECLLCKVERECPGTFCFLLSVSFCSVLFSFLPSVRA